MDELCVNDLMTADLIALRSHDRIGRARELLLGLGINALPVVDDEGTIVGIVSSRDLVEEWHPGEPVSTPMSTAVATIAPDATIADAARVMLAEHIHHLVVMNGKDLVGILSTFDLLEPIARGEVRMRGDLGV